MNPEAPLSPNADFNLIAALERAGFALTQALESDLTNAPFVPVVDERNIETAFFDSQRALIKRSRGFPDLVEPEFVHSVGLVNSSSTFIIRHFQDQEKRMHLVALIANQSLASKYQAPGRPLLSPDPNVNVVAVSLAGLDSQRSLEFTARSLGLTPGQARLTAALSGHGDLRRAAKELGITYATARTATTDAMSRLGVSKRAAMVAILLSASLGIVPDRPNSAPRVAEALGLTLRQAKLAQAVSQGGSRTDAARAAGVSAAVAKKELADVFLAMGVQTAAELSRKWIEAQALVVLASTIGRNASVDILEPLTFIKRPNGGKIAVSDYGPPEGKPVLLLHSSSACRALPHVLLDAMHQAGLRPISMDRPGFGLSEDMSDGEPSDPFLGACDDIRTVLTHFGFQSVDLIARGGAQVAVALASESPDLLRRVILVAPDPPTHASFPARGILRLVKALFRVRPDLISFFAAAMTTRMTTMSLHDFVLEACADSQPDLAVMRDPKNFSDYVRGFRPFLAGNLAGYLREQIAMASDRKLPLVLNAEQWSVFIGSHDFLHGAAEAKAYWKSILPDAHFEAIEDGGRYISFSHADQIVSQLVGNANTEAA